MMINCKAFVLSISPELAPSDDASGIHSPVARSRILSTDIVPLPLKSFIHIKDLNSERDRNSECAFERDCMKKKVIRRKYRTLQGLQLMVLLECLLFHLNTIKPGTSKNGVYQCCTILSNCGS